MLEQDMTASHWDREVEELDLKLESGIWWDYFTSASLSICVFRRTSEDSFLTLLKLADALIPCSDYLTDTNLEVERPAFLH